MLFQTRMIHYYNDDDGIIKNKNNNKVWHPINNLIKTDYNSKLLFYSTLCIVDDNILRDYQPPIGSKKKKEKLI